MLYLKEREKGWEMNYEAIVKAMIKYDAEIECDISNVDWIPDKYSIFSEEIK